MQQNGEYSLYFHIPFCTRKCDYCHFYVIPDQERFQTLYMEALKKEWNLRSLLLPSDGKLISIYFGGGTPSLLGPNRIETILSWISPGQNVEITLEANPETICTNFPFVNRMSLGVQSFDDTHLVTLTRTHHAQQAQTAIHKVIESGIHNLSIDLMYDLPGQTLSSWEKTLDTALSLPITHLSLYNLSFEPHTTFYKKRSSLQSQVPDQATSLEMLEMAIDKLTKSSFRQYEISAFCKPGFESQHNIGYWKRRPFLGLGPSAFSYWKGARFQNHANLHRYSKKLEQCHDPMDFYEKLAPIEQIKEQLAIRLRLLEPLEAWPQALKNLYPLLQKEGYLDAQSLKLSKKGLLFHDTVAEIIMSDHTT